MQEHWTSTVEASGEAAQAWRFSRGRGGPALTLRAGGALTSPGLQGIANQEDTLNSGAGGKAAGSPQNWGARSRLLLGLYHLHVGIEKVCRPLAKRKSSPLLGPLFELLALCLIPFPSPPFWASVLCWGTVEVCGRPQGPQGRLSKLGATSDPQDIHSIFCILIKKVSTFPLGCSRTEAPVNLLPRER